MIHNLTNFFINNISIECIIKMKNYKALGLNDVQIKLHKCQLQKELCNR